MQDDALQHDHDPVVRNPMIRVKVSSIRRDWLGLLLVALGWLGVGLTHLATDTVRDPASREAALLTSGLGVATLAAIGSGAMMAVNAVKSPLQYAFRSRPAFRCAAALLLSAGLAIVLLSQSQPLEGLLAYGRPLPEMVAALTLSGVAAVSILCAVVALDEGWRERRNEQRWC